MAVTQYIGARYVPLFSEPLDWDISKEYEPLTIVYYAGNSYTSRQAVPKNIEITNEDYWALTGNYNAQIEQYRKEVAAYDAKIKANTTLINDEKTRALAAEKVNSDAIAAEKTRALAAEKVNSDAIAAEKTRALAAEKVNSDAIAAEKTRALAAEKVNSDAISDIARYAEIRDYLTPEYIGDFVTYNGKFYTSSSNKPYINQGYCFNGTDHVFAMKNDDDSATTFTKANEANNSFTLGTNTYSGMGHSNCLAYNESTGHYLLYTDNTLNQIKVLSSSFSTIKNLTVPIGDYGSIAFDRKTKKVWFADYNGDIYELENESTFTKRMTLSEAVTYPDGVVGQGFAVYDGIAVFPFSGIKNKHYKGLKIYDFNNNGQFVKYVNFPLTGQLGKYGEMEDADFDSEGNLYISSIKDNVNGEQNLRYCMVTYLWKTNLYIGNPASEGTPIGTELNLDPIIAGNNFRSTGRPEEPFKDLAEWNIYVSENDYPSRHLLICEKTSSNVELKGIVVFSNAENVVIKFNSNNNVTINGGFLVRAGGNFNIWNRMTIKEPPYDYPFTYLVRISNANWNGYSIVGTSTNKVTNALYLQGSVDVNIAAASLNGTANKYDASAMGGGAGITIGSPKK